jgi:hypothetical protein
VATPLSVPPEEDDGLEESESSDPHADNPAPITSAAASAANGFMRLRPFERAMLTWMCIKRCPSFPSRSQD